MATAWDSFAELMPVITARKSLGFDRSISLTRSDEAAPHQIDILHKILIRLQCVDRVLRANIVRKARHDRELEFFAARTIENPRRGASD